MSTIATPRRTPVERALIDYVRADAWRFDDPAEREEDIAKLLRDAPGAYSIYELNALYEMVCLVPTVVEIVRARTSGDEKIITFDIAPRSLEDTVPEWLGMNTTTWDEESVFTAGDIPRIPFQLMVAITALASRGMDHDAVVRTLDVWRKHVMRMCQIWKDWTKPEALPNFVAVTIAHGESNSDSDAVKSRRPAMRPVLTLCCEAIMRLAWIFECEAADAITFGPVSERRLPRDPAAAVVTLRRFVEQQPELRKVPAFVHVATAGTDWLRPRDYGRLRVQAADDEQTAAVAIDAITNRHYLHDHMAVIEVDRKPWKSLVLAPEYLDRVNGTRYLNAILTHEKGSFVAEVMVRGDTREDLVLGLVLPFGSHAWRGAPEGYGGDGTVLPPDSAVTALIVAAWRDLIVAKVRDEQYVQTVERDSDDKPGRRPERKAKRGHVKVVRYLPRMVANRREEEADRAEHGQHGPMRRAYRVGTFAKLLREGTKRSMEASEFAADVGMPLRDDQTVTRPHIRGGTEDEREALLAQDDVRLWRSWAAVDLAFATRTPGAVE